MPLTIVLTKKAPQLLDADTMRAKMLALKAEFEAYTIALRKSISMTTSLEELKADIDAFLAQIEKAAFRKAANPADYRRFKADMRAIKATAKKMTFEVDGILHVMAHVAESSVSSDEGEEVRGGLAEPHGSTPTINRDDCDFLCKDIDAQRKLWESIVGSSNTETVLKKLRKEEAKLLEALEILGLIRPCKKSRKRKRQAE